MAASAVAAGTVTLHRWAGTWTGKVTRYIALNDFCRRKFIAGGLPAERVVVKPNFVAAAPLPDVRALRAGGLFVGRLSPEKGFPVLEQAARGLPAGTIRVIGDGEDAALAREAFGDDFLGFRPLDEILASMRSASFLVIPSLWYENFPRTIVEAFASGLPVIASRIGALAELVRDGRTGLLFEPGNAADLRARLDWALSHPREMAAMGRNARQEYDERYTPARNLELLEDIYREAMFEAHGGEIRVA
jgi:glycosyltransferase involved in cell wall biosynthesis